MVVVFELRMMLGAFGAGERVANRIKKVVEPFSLNLSALESFGKLSRERE